MVPGTCIGVISAIGAKVPVKIQARVKYEGDNHEVFDIVGWAIDEDGNGYPLALMNDGTLVPVPQNDDKWEILSGDAVVKWES
jgi:hypothetical protein